MQTNYGYDGLNRSGSSRGSAAALPMIMPKREHNKRYGVYGLGIVAGLLGVATAYFGLDDPLIRSIGILMCLGGAYLIKIAKAPGQMRMRRPRNKGLSPADGGRTGRFLWILGAVSLVASLVSFLLMNNDALHGYNGAWEIYAFIVSGTLFMMISACIVGVSIWKMFKH